MLLNLNHFGNQTQTPNEIKTKEELRIRVVTIED